MAPKQHMGKEVATSAMATPPPPTIERLSAGRGFYLFSGIFSSLLKPSFGYFMVNLPRFNMIW